MLSAVVSAGKDMVGYDSPIHLYWIPQFSTQMCIDQLSLSLTAVSRSAVKTEASALKQSVCVCVFVRRMQTKASSLLCLKHIPALILTLSTNTLPRRGGSLFSP